MRLVFTLMQISAHNYHNKMKIPTASTSKILVSILLQFTVAVSAFSQPGKKSLPPTQRLTSQVNPFIGTDGFGHTFPGATLPFGMVQLSPDTRTSGWENCSGYHSTNTTILGFSHTHLSGTGASDYGDILMMPTIGKQLQSGDENNPLSGYRSAFSKTTERAQPGYYRVRLDDYGIQAELTATTRCGFHKYTFPASDSSIIITDLVHGISDKVTDASITIINDHAIEGYRRSTGWAKDHIIYFYAEFSKPFAEGHISDASGKEINGNTYQSGEGVKAWFRYKTAQNQSVLVKVGISTVSSENARLNLTTEIPDWDFTKTLTDASSAWERELSRIKVEGGSPEDRINFYTALYHTMIAPNIMSDTDGRYRGMDGAIHKMEKGNMYTVFSLWDTFRALHPLFTIIDPERAADFVRTLLKKYEESSMLPVWELASNETGCMIGYHSVPVIADAWFKGIRDFDQQLALKAMINSGSADHLGMQYYKQRGYVPADKENESVSKTLEYCYNDWCIYEMGKSLGINTSEIQDFRRRSLAYQNVYDAETGFMRGKKNSNWVTPFDPYEVSGIYTEANAWQYTWFVPHDVPGMIRLMGGNEKFNERLNELFTTHANITGRSQPDISGMIGQYAHGNEPSHHMIYLYQWTQTPYQTAALSRKILKEFYTNKRDGLIGNEDCGQMSAWFVFSAMGFYPVCPGTDDYYFGSPLFSKISINNGKNPEFTIIADSAATRTFVADVLYNNVSLNSSRKEKGAPMTLKHGQLMAGGKLEFRMSEIPANYNASTSLQLPKAAMCMSPYLVSDQRSFLDSCKVEMHCYQPGTSIYYTTDGTEPTERSSVYKTPVYFNNTTTLKMKTFCAGYEPGFTEEASFLKLPYRRTITYQNKYSHLYTAGGDNGLIDGITGDPNSFGSWQGFHATDLDVTIDLESVRNIQTIAASFLQQYPSWIWFPVSVEFQISDDGKEFRSVYSETNKIADNKEGALRETYSCNLPAVRARYVRVIAKNRNVCPPWHPGAGDKAWIFADEIEIK